MGLITNIQELARTARQAANDVAGTVVDVRNASANVRESSLLAEARLQQARAVVAASAPKPTEVADIGARSSAMTAGGLNSSVMLLIVGAVVVLFLARGR